MIKKNIVTSLIIISAIVSTGCTTMLITPLVSDNMAVEYNEISDASGMDESALLAIDQVRYDYDFSKANPTETLELFLNIKIQVGRSIFIIHNYNDYINVMNKLGLKAKGNLTDALEHLYDLQSDENMSVLISFYSIDEVMDILHFSADQKELARAIYTTGLSMSDTMYGDVAISDFDISQYGNKTFVPPSPDATIITSPFGWRIHPRYGTRKFHTGIDLARNGNAYGLPVLAIYDGAVTSCGYESAGGNYIFLNHLMPDKTVIKSGYMHLSMINVKQGQSVKRGDVIGYIGNSGVSTGPHLHFMIYINGTLSNPTKILNQ